MKPCVENGNIYGLHEALGSRAKLLKAGGKHEEAMALHKEEERICRELKSKHGLRIVLGHQANILSMWGRLDEVIGYCTAEKRTRALADYYVNRAMCLETIGDVKGSRKDLLAAVETASALKYRLQKATALGATAGLISREEGSETDLSLDLYEKQEAICRELKETFCLCQCLANQALLPAKKKKEIKISMIFRIG